MRIGVTLCAIAVSALIVPSAWAGLVGDQYEHDPYLAHDQYQTEWDISYNIGGSTKMAQTFTAGQTGILDHIDIGNLTGVYYEPQSPPVEIRIYGELPNLNLNPNPQPLASAILPISLLTNDWTLGIEPRDSSMQKISVETGTMYSIVLWGNVATVGATTSDDYYDRGALWAWGDWDDDYETPDTWGLLSGTYPPTYDMQFQTYVVPVPLPAGVWLGICAVGVAGWHLKRQRG
jgi:hypothetical protein